VQGDLRGRGVRLVASDHYVNKAAPLWLVAGLHRDGEYLEARGSSRRSLEAMWGSLAEIGRITGVKCRLSFV